MDKEQVRLFNDSLTWWRDFFDDLKTLFDKIAIIIEKDLGYDEKTYYYYKSNEAPSIPSAYFLCLSGEGKVNIQMCIILDRDYLDASIIKASEPIILVILNDCEENTTAIGYAILENKDINQVTETEGIITGTLDWDPEVKFTACRIPLDVFEKYDDEIVRERIVRKIDQISNK